jgi:hypothetical protein
VRPRLAATVTSLVGDVIGVGLAGRL